MLIFALHSRSPGVQVPGRQSADLQEPAAPPMLCSDIHR